MMYPKNNTEKLNDNLFENPTAEYRGIPFWSWNCKVSKELIDWQLDCFKSMGFGGVDIHPRTGLNTEYLSDEYLELTAYAAERCKEKGLACWLYDDDRFPSGSAGGMVTRERWTRGRYLLITEKHGDKEKTGTYMLPGYCSGREESERQDSAALGYYAGAFTIRLQNGFLTEYHRLADDGMVESALASGEKVRFVYVKLFQEERWFEGRSYVDTMNPAAIKVFLDSTHEKYYELLGKEFGKSIPAIFTDEPRMAPRGQRSFALTFAESDEDIIVPYTEYCGKQMRKRYGADVMEMLPEYIWELPDGKKSLFRYRYQDMLAECFTEAFMDQICEWCEKHGIAMTGHVLGEDSLLAQTWLLGDCMRCYRNMDLPGVDILVDYRQFLTVKQAASVAKQNGKEGVVSELYGVTGWNCDFKTYKLQGDWQAALGVTIRIPHLSWMSMEGEAKRDWPASIFYQSPWYTEFPYIEDYFSRLNTVLTRGKARTHVAVVHPVESAWMVMGPNEQTREQLLELDGQLNELVQWLLFGTIDFDFVSESLMTEQCTKITEQKDDLSVDEKHLRTDDAAVFRVGHMAYDVVIIPGLSTIRSSTLDNLELFVSRGGAIIFMGEIPSYVDAVSSDRARALAKKCLVIPRSEHTLMKVLSKYRDIEIYKMDGTHSDNLFYQLRQDKSCGWLFLCHVNSRKHLSEESYRIRIKGTYQLSRYDAQTGEIEKLEDSVKIVYREGFTEFYWSCYAQDSLLLCLKKMTEDSKKNLLVVQREYKTIAYLSVTDFYEREEPNMMLLDYAEYQIDDGIRHGREEILRADNRIREMLGYTPHGDAVEQPWFLEAKEEHMVRLFYSFFSEIQTEASLGIERTDLCKVWLNDQEVRMEPDGYFVDRAIHVVSLPLIKAGENRLTVEVRYDQKGSLENLYLLGDFDVELQASHAVIRKCRKRLSVGDITRQGMPFYTGNLDYHFHFNVEEPGEYTVQVRCFDGPVLGVIVDDKDMGRIAYAPHRLSLGELSVGEHHLTVRLYGNRFNGFGHLHNINDEFEWIGPAAYRTVDDEWTDCYRVRSNGILSAVEIQKRL